MSQEVSVRLIMNQLIVLIVAATMGCSSYRPTAPLPAPMTEVRVSFAAPRDIAVRSPAGDSILLANVRELRGAVVRSQLDTRMDHLRIRLGSAHGPSGGLSNVPEGAIATIPRDMFVRVEQRSFDPMKTLRVVGYIAGAALLVSLLAIGLALDSA